jgi:multiple antibiotic resistance protein
MKLYLQAFITIIALINPVICGAMFLASEQGRSVPERVMDASKAAFSILVILVVTALFGIRMLDLFGISLDVFSMAGGSVLVWMGSKMIRAATAPSSQPSSLTSLVVFAASPGTIAGVIAIAATHTGRQMPVTALAGVGAAVLLTWLFMIILARGSSKPADSGFIHSIVQSFMGLIVMAMGLQIALKGLSGYFKLVVN